MSIDVTRLFGSSFNAQASASPIAWMVGHKLWYRSWHQVPAASLPDDEGELCHLAELGFDLKTFRKVRAAAMRGWVKADDGRLYHPVIAEMALISWLEKLLQRLKSGLGNAKRWKATFDSSEIQEQIRQAALMLSTLNPRAPVLTKETVVRALGGIPIGTSAGPDGDPNGTPTGDPTGNPSGMPEGLENDPTGNPSAFPQAIPRERERERELEDSGSPLRSEPETRALEPIVTSTLDLNGVGRSLVLVSAAEPRRKGAKPRSVTLDNITADERAAFEAWWAAYPHKVSKQDALIAFVKVLRSGELTAEFLAERAQAYGAWLHATDTKPANGATWLNGRRWEDQLTIQPRHHQQPRGQWSSTASALSSLDYEEEF